MRMKRMLLGLCLVSLLGTSAWSADLSDLTVNGEIRTRGFYLLNYKGTGNADNFILTRALIDLGLEPAENLRAVLTVGTTRLWGRNSSVFQVEEPGAAQALTGDLYNAYVKVNPWQDFSLTIGRQYAGEKDDAFFFYGPQKGRLLEVTTLDALRFDLVAGPVEVFGLAGKKAETDSALTQVGTGKDQDQDILALSVKSTRLVEKQDFSLALYQRRIGQQAGWAQSDNLYLVTARAKGALPLPGLEYDLMGGLNAGSDRRADKYTGWLARAIGYYTLSELPLASYKVTAGYVYVSGDTTAGDGKDGNFHRMSRDCFYNMALIVYELLNDTAPEAVANVTIPFVGLDITPKILEDKLKLKAMYSYLSAPATITAGGHENHDKGSEIYLRLEYPVSDNLALEMTGSRFWPGELFQALYRSGRPYDQITLDATVSF